ncbi:MAG: hypothetical protein U0572_03145 [Phycisphaerales bacterium]
MEVGGEGAVGGWVATDRIIARPDSAEERIGQAFIADYDAGSTHAPSDAP